MITKSQIFRRWVETPTCRPATGRCLTDRNVAYEAKIWNTPVIYQFAGMERKTN